MKLYELTNEIEALQAQVDAAALENDGIISDDLYSQIESLEGEKDVKIENVALWIKSLKAEADALKREKSILDKRKRVTENLAKSVTTYLSSALQGDKFKTERVSISYRKSTFVNVIDKTFIPSEFLKTTIEPRLSDIKKAGGCEGATIETKNNIQIR